MREQLVVIGGGWAGCAAALAAVKKGLPVTLVERTDRLLASGLVGGIMRNNGRYSAAEELKLMGAGELIDITDAAARHSGIDFPGHRHASLYDVEKVELPVERLLLESGVRLLRQSRAVDALTRDGIVEAVRVLQGDGEDGKDGVNGVNGVNGGDGGGREELLLRGTVFIDAGGTAGPLRNCSRFGNGCAMCIYRCPTFGPRVSIAVKAGAAERRILRRGGAPGYFSGSCELEPASLALWLREEVREKGVVVIPLPARALTPQSSLSIQIKACRQYSSEAYAHNLILLDTGAIKMMVPYLPLSILRSLHGLEEAVFRDPLGGGRGNSIRFSGIIERDRRLLVPPLKNLFAAGERAGLSLGHTEAMVTGTLAGHNAWRLSRGEELLQLPRGCVCGELIALTALADLPAGGSEKYEVVYSLSGGPLWEHLRRQNLYSTDTAAIKRRLDRLGLLGIFAAK